MPDNNVEAILQALVAEQNENNRRMNQKIAELMSLTAVTLSLLQVASKIAQPVAEERLHFEGMLRCQVIDKQQC
ncbi:hypothetical protein PsorP6_000854 [Peronosclerospora sorghi]|uniref:Uncharacterized protein n=1 Tax=Peronosclerospora sorghi TaxID=230839 RepID=A0ACC0WVP5_9STRA|nr:hypothetical protein PsorP6_000854 [Peronosclerospora sorghi]